MPESVDQRLCDLSLVDVATKIQNREVSPVEVTEAVLARIATLDAQLNAFVTILPDQARQQAQQAETKIADGEYRGPLHGIPVSIKDLFATAGVRTTAGSRILADNVPNETATVVARLPRRARSWLERPTCSSSRMVRFMPNAVRRETRGI